MSTVCASTIHQAVSPDVAAPQEPGRNGTFRVICTSYGGKPLSMSITGPSGVEQDVMNMIEVGTADGTGNDIFSAEIQHNGGSDGDRYNCNASNVVSSLSQTSTLKGLR